MTRHISAQPEASLTQLHIHSTHSFIQQPVAFSLSPWVFHAAGYESFKLNLALLRSKFPQITFTGANLDRLPLRCVCWLCHSPHCALMGSWLFPTFKSPRKDKDVTPWSPLKKLRCEQKVIENQKVLEVSQNHGAILYYVPP